MSDDPWQKLRPDAEAFTVEPLQTYKARDPIKPAENAPFLAFGIATRKTAPVEFWMCVHQALHPLNVRMGYIIQKAADRPDGLLGAAARNAILQRAQQQGASYTIFMDDDILFPDISLYRLLNLARAHPEAAVITGVYTSKIEPVEPILYQDNASGAFWDWALGELVPIHSAGAGCFIVNMAYLQGLEPPWFNDTLPVGGGSNWGHDRYFMRRLSEEAGGRIYADTGLLVGHFDAQTQRVYVMPPSAPCFQRAPVSESYIPVKLQDGTLMWRRVLPAGDGHPEAFLGYTEWLESRGPKGASEIRFLETATA